MKFWEAMRAAENGEKVKPTQSGNGCYVTKDNYNYVHGGCDRSELVLLFRLMSYDWSVIELPDLTFEEAVKGLKEGKKYRRKLWDKHEYIYASTYIYDERHSPYTFDIQDFDATDWVEV